MQSSESNALKASVDVSIEVVLLTELVRQRNAREKLAPLALNRVHVEEHDQAGEDAQEKRERHKDLHAFAVHVHAPKTDVGQEGEGEEEAWDESTDVGEVIDPGKHAEGKEEEHYARELGEGSPRSCQDLPALEQLHEQTRQDAKLRTCRTHLSSEEEYRKKEGLLACFIDWQLV